MSNKREKNKTTEVLRVQQNSKNGQKYLYIPKHSELIKDDLVIVKKLEDSE